MSPLRRTASGTVNTATGEFDEPLSEEDQARIDRVVDEANNPTPSNIAEYSDAGYEAILPDYEDVVDAAYEVSVGAVPKSELVNVPFGIYQYEFRQGNLFVDADDPSVEMEYARGGIMDRITRLIVSRGNKLEFVVVHAVTAPGSLRKPEQPGYLDAESEHVVFVDGGTGIYKSLRELYDKRGVVRIKSKRGLRASSYTGPHGGPSTTYYLG